MLRRNESHLYTYAFQMNYWFINSKLNSELCTPCNLLITHFSLLTSHHLPLPQSHSHFVSRSSPLPSLSHFLSLFLFVRPTYQLTNLSTFNSQLTPVRRSFNEGGTHHSHLSLTIILCRRHAYGTSLILPYPHPLPASNIGCDILSFFAGQG